MKQQSSEARPPNTASPTLSFGWLLPVVVLVIIIAFVLSLEKHDASGKPHTNSIKTKKRQTQLQETTRDTKPKKTKPTQESTTPPQGETVRVVERRDQVEVSLLAYLTLSHDSAKLGFIHGKSFGFAPEKTRQNSELFEFRMTKDSELRYLAKFHVDGLIPKAMNRRVRTKELRLGDQIFAKEMPKLLSLPYLEPPFTLSIFNSENKKIGEFSVTEIQGSNNWTKAGDK